MPSDSAPTAIWTSPSFSEFPNHIVGASVYFVCEGSMKITFNEALLVRFGEFPNHIVGASGASGASRRTGTHRDAQGRGGRAFFGASPPLKGDAPKTPVRGPVGASRMIDRFCPDDPDDYDTHEPGDKSKRWVPGFLSDRVRSRLVEMAGKGLVDCSGPDLRRRRA